MKTTVKHIKGHDYLYAYDSIFIAHRKSDRRQKSLGPVDSITDLSAKKRAFIEFITTEEIKQRVAYWTPKVTNQKILEHISIQKIEDLRASLYRAKKGMGEVAIHAMENAFLVDFIYNSNRLEGSQIPRERVEEEVREKIKPKNKGEVGNTLRALYEVDTKFKFNVKGIVGLHTILMAHEPEKLGLRKGKVVVGNSEVAPWGQIKEKLIELCEWYKEKKWNTYPPELAFDFYYKFERIHPFEDGNGRMGRLIMNHILKENRYHPIIISWKRKQAQENAFRKRMEGQVENFYDFMKEEFVKTHEIYIGKISDAINFEKLSEIFFSPSPAYKN